MKTIVLDDSTASALLAALQAANPAPPPPVGQPPSAPPPLPPAIGYEITRVTLDDALYLYKMSYDYATALRNLPGSHQLHYDILTLNGKTWWHMAGAAQADMQLRLSRVINEAGADNTALATQYDTSKYAGPLRNIYNNLVAAKLSGKA